MLVTHLLLVVNTSVAILAIRRLLILRLLITILLLLIGPLVRLLIAPGWRSILWLWGLRRTREPC